MYCKFVIYQFVTIKMCLGNPRW